MSEQPVSRQPIRMSETLYAQVQARRSSRGFTIYHLDEHSLERGQSLVSLPPDRMDVTDFGGMPYPPGLFPPLPYFGGMPAMPYPPGLFPPLPLLYGPYLAPQLPVSSRILAPPWPASMLSSLIFSGVIPIPSQDSQPSSMENSSGISDSRQPSSMASSSGILEFAEPASMDELWDSDESEPTSMASSSEILEFAEPASMDESWDSDESEPTSMASSSEILEFAEPASMDESWDSDESEPTSMASSSEILEFAEPASMDESWDSDESEPTSMASSSEILEFAEPASMDELWDSDESEPTSMASSSEILEFAEPASMENSSGISEVSEPTSMASSTLELPQPTSIFPSQQVSSWYQKLEMARRSARLLKHMLTRHDSDSDEVQRKVRRTDRSQESTVSTKGQQFMIENLLLPISPSEGVTSSMIVPLDEADSLACQEELPPLKPSSSGDSMAGCSKEKDEEVVTIVTTTPQPSQHLRFSNHFTPEMTVMNPLPQIDWADPRKMWDALIKKEQKYPHSADMFAQHPMIREYMRPVLLSWLTEVCELYKLHKETYYLAIEFIDRYMLFSEGIPASDLQLVGVTALFMAAKIEEIYPPKTSDFSYVCDGAYDEDAIHSYELQMIQELKWLLNPLTPNTWIQLYLQIAAVKKEKRNRAPRSPDIETPAGSLSDQNASSGATLLDLATCALSQHYETKLCVSEKPEHVESSASAEITRTDSLVDSSSRPASVKINSGSGTDSGEEESMEEEEEEEEEEPSVVYPLYSEHDYMQASRLMDLVILDVNSFHFSYRVLAAAAVHLTTDIEDICLHTGLTEEELEPCVRWMTIHSSLLNKNCPLPVTAKTFDNVKECNAHKIQCNIIEKTLWEEANSKSEDYFKMKKNLELLMVACEQQRQQSERCSSPIPSTSAFITPPRSNKKMMPEMQPQQ